MSNTKNKIMIMFPYGGFYNEPHKERMFFRLLHTAMDLAEEQVLVVINKDTESRSKQGHGLCDTFKEKIQDARYTDRVEPLYVWSVDTCQMWLHGWGHILDHYPGRRIVQLPGDLAAVSDPDSLFNKLETFITLETWPVVVGDFSSNETHSSKDLIDEYGTLPLMANWFPDVARAVSKKRLKRPRTEFLNIDHELLKQLLQKRKFAYEQTLNFLIQIWYMNDPHTLDNQIHVFDLGEFRDEEGFRKYTDCLDQIERMERMLKMLWREKNKPKNQASEPEFIDRYETLDLRSTSIRENARIIIQNLLRIEEVGIV
jgi:hypothetical protein